MEAVAFVSLLEVTTTEARESPCGRSGMLRAIDPASDMAAITCPRCGFLQQGGQECLRCGVIFERLRSRPETPPQADPGRRRGASPAAPVRDAPARLEDDATPRPSAIRRAYRAFRLVVLAALVVVVVLMLRKDAPPEQTTDATARQRVEAKMDGAAQAVSLGAPYTLALDEAELNALLAEHLLLAPPAGAGRRSPAAEPSVEEVRSNVRDVRVQLIEDRVSIWLLFDFHGKDLTLTLEARLSARDGRLQIAPVAGRLGKLPLPRAALERGVQRALDDPANAANLVLPREIRDIRVEDSRLRIDWAADGRSDVPSPSE